MARVMGVHHSKVQRILNDFEALGYADRTEGSYETVESEYVY